MDYTIWISHLPRIFVALSVVGGSARPEIDGQSQGQTLRQNGRQRREDRGDGLLEIGFFGGGLGNGGLGLVDGGEGLDVEAFVVGVAGGGVDVEAFHEEDADADVGFFVGGEPDLVAEVGLFEEEVGSLS